MPTVEELAVQLQGALDRIARLERLNAGTDLDLTDIRTIVLNLRSDVAGLTQGQARLELALDGLIGKAEAVDSRTAALSERIGAIEVRLEALEARVGTGFAHLDDRLTAHDEQFAFIRTALGTILDRLPEPE